MPSRICCKVNSCEGGSSVRERDVPVVDALVAHVAAQDATVGCESGGGDAQVIVHLEHLLRVRRQLRWSPLQAGQNYVAVALQSAQHQPHQHVTRTSCTGNELVGHRAAYGCDVATKSRSRFSACHLCERHVDPTTPQSPCTSGLMIARSRLVGAKLLSRRTLVKGLWTIASSFAAAKVQRSRAHQDART